MEYTPQLLSTFAISAAIGLLVGLERERHPLAKAGLRTFTLIALVGTLAAMIAEETGSLWIMAAAVLAVTVTLAGAFFVDPRTTPDDSGTTTVVAAIAVFFLGALNFFGDHLLTLTIGVFIAALLHFKPELEGFTQKLTAQDIRSMLQFAILTAVVLPLVPNEPFGPFGVLNPFQIWLMVLLISGVSLAGYVAWRLTLAYGARLFRAGLLLTGMLGGVVSSTATTLVYARHARTGTQPGAVALFVIVLANATMLARLLLFAAVVAPHALPTIALTLVPAALFALPTLVRPWHAASDGTSQGTETYRNPTNLLVALAFAAGYSLVLLISAWASETVGTLGLYTLALLSGSTDVDAISLSALQLFNTSTVSADVAATVIAIAAGANLAMKSVLVFATGGHALGRATATAFLGPLLGLGVGLAAVHY